MSASSLIRLYYVFQLMVTLTLWTPIFYQYQKQMGLSDPQIFGIQSIYYISFCVLEIPTGFLADRLGHRGCMRLGALLHILTHALPILVPTYGGFLVHWFLFALARSLISGAASAYLYNRLEQLDQLALYKDAEGRARAWSLAAKVLGFGVTDALTAVDPSLPYWGSAAAAVVATVAAWRFPSFQNSPAEQSDEPVRLSEAFRQLRHAPRLQIVIAQGVALFTLTRIVQVNLFQPLLLDSGFRLDQLGRIMALNTVFEAVAAGFPRVLRRWFTDFQAVFWLTWAMAGCCWALADPGPWSRVIWLNVFALVTGLSYPIQRQVMNEHIPDSRYRASMLSAESLLDRAVCAWVAFRLGDVVKSGGTGPFLILSAQVSSVACLVLWPLYALLARRDASAMAAEASKTPAP